MVWFLHVCYECAMTNESLPWRDYLTDEERAVIEQADAAKIAWQAFNDRRAGIVNRAIQRARYALGRRGNHVAPRREPTGEPANLRSAP